MSEERYEYVSETRSHKHSSFVRRRPYTNDNPTQTQRKTRYRFAKAAHEARDKKGTVILEDGKEVPKPAEAVQKQMKDKRLAEPKIPRFIPPELAAMVQLREAMSKLARKR